MSRFSRLALAAVALAIPVAIGVSSLQAQAGSAARPAHAAVHVAIQGFAFSPAKITITPGTTVTWTNMDNVDHTVSSDNNAWTDSGNIADGGHFSFTFTKPGTYTYHCAVHPTMVASVVVAASGSSRGATSGPGMGMGMGPMSMTSVKTWTGYYDEHKVLFLSTDTTSKMEAINDHINYAPALAKALPASSKIYIFTNGRFASRGPAFGSEPGEDDYTPLWQEVLVTWKDPAKATFLGSDDDVKSKAKAGLVTLKTTGVVLNCPIIKVMKGGS